MFAIIATMIVIDQNVGAYIILIFKIMKVNFERVIWMIRFHPVILSSPIARWWMMRKYMKEAEKLQQELQETISK